MDILFSSYLARKRRLLSFSDFRKIYNLINNFSLPLYYDLFCADKLWKSLYERTQHRDGCQHFPVPIAIGKNIFLNDITFTELKILCEDIILIVLQNTSFYFIKMLWKQC